MTVVLCVVVVVVVVGRGTLVVVVSVSVCVVIVVAVGRTVVVRVVDTVVLTVHTHLRFFRHFSPNSKVSSWAFELAAPMIGSTIANRTIASFSRNPLLCIFDAAALQSEFLLSCLPIIASIANKYGSFRATLSDLGYADWIFLARHKDLILWPILTELYPVPIRDSIKRTGTGPRITILDEPKRFMCNRWYYRTDLHDCFPRSEKRTSGGQLQKETVIGDKKRFMYSHYYYYDYYSDHTMNNLFWCHA